MDKLAEIIEEQRKLLGYSQAELAEAIKMNRGVLNRKLNGHSTFKRDEQKKLAEVFGISLSQLDSMWASDRVPQIQGDLHQGMPLLGEIPAGVGDYEYAYDQGVGEGYISRNAVNIEDPLAFALKVKGDSMMPELSEGEVVICSPSAVHSKGFQDNLLYAVRFDGELDNETTIKRVKLLPSHDKVELIPDNKRYPNRIVNTANIIRAALVVGKITMYKGLV